MSPRISVFLIVFSWFALFGTTSAQQPNVPPGSRFVMSHFKNDGGGGDERLYISVSPDGLNWTALNGGNPVWQPDGWHGFGNVVRDPSIIYDNGYYWVAYTSGNYGNHESFGLVKSRDLLNWTVVGQINVLVPGAPDQLTWNPVFFRDGDGSVHVFINISPTGGSTYNPAGTMRTYETHPVNADWTEWSTPVLINLPGNNSNEFFAWKEGDTYHAIYVDFSSGSAWIKVSSQSLTSGWGNAQTIGSRGMEGGMILKIPDGSGYRFYAEPGNGSSGTYATSDLNGTFTAGTAFQPVQSSIGMRNGKMTALVGTTSFTDWQAQELSGLSLAEQSATADPDSDGLVNLLEAASALEPLSPARNGHPVLGVTSLSLTYRRAPWLAITLQPEASPDLFNWELNSLHTDSITLLTDGTEEIVVRDTTATSAARFMRLRATIPAAAPTTMTQVRKAPIRRTLRAKATRRMR